MSATTSIEWTRSPEGAQCATWNPVTGCTKGSPDCDHCYAERFAERFRGVRGHPYAPGFELTLRPERLGEPLRWARPRRIFVCSMADLFHASVPSDYIQRCFDSMRAARRHTFLVLTKRDERLQRLASKRPYVATLPNVWVGVSVESPAFLARVRHLQETPAALRWLSCEPLLAPLSNLPLDGIRWVVVGGENGPGARPMHPDWVRDIRDQCAAAGVALFFKQWGSWSPRSARALVGSACAGAPRGGGRLLDERIHDAYPATDERCMESLT